MTNAIVLEFMCVAKSVWAHLFQSPICDLDVAELSGLAQFKKEMLDKV